MNIAEKILSNLDNVHARIHGLEQRAQERARQQAERDARDESERRNRQRYADSVDQVEYLKLKRDIAAMKRADEAEVEERREREVRYAERRVEHRARYEEVFRPFGVTINDSLLPGPDEHPPTYRRRLYAAGQLLLPQGHKMREHPADEIPGNIIRQFEGMLFEALAEEAKRPTGSNLPEFPTHPRAVRHIVDDATGQRTTEYHAKRSFIANLSRPGHIVHRLTDGNGHVLHGPPYPARPQSSW
jgi:hypothetical protein